jgi:serine/threonine protein phosphatase PrpC
MPVETPPAPSLLLRENLTAPRLVEAAGAVAAVYSARSPTKESDNEDAAAVVPIDEKRAVLMVADGLGGQAAGAEAAGLAIRALADQIGTAVAGEGQLRTAILDGFEQANDAVAAMAVGAATTMAVVEIDGQTARPYHVGDSMILIVGQRGKRKLQTVSHSPVGYAVEAGLLKESEAMHHEDRHLVSNIVGCPQMRIEVGPLVQLRPRDTIVVASDGLFDNLHLEEIVELVRKGPLEKAAGALAQAAGERMIEPASGHPSKPDDLTIVLFRPGPAAR